MKTTIIMIALTLYVLILWGMLIYVWRKGIKEWRRNKDNKPHEYRVTVMDKREIKDTSDEPDLWQCLVLFDISGRQVEYSVPLESYTGIRVGQTGMLKIENLKFQDFIPDEQKDHYEDLFDKIVKG